MAQGTCGRLSCPDGGPPRGHEGGRTGAITPFAPRCASTVQRLGSCTTASQPGQQVVPQGGGKTWT